MASRPRLNPYFRPLRRGRGAVQLGLSAESGGIILTGLTPSEVTLLERLDGSLSQAEVYAVAASAGLDRRRADELLTLLREHHVLVTEVGDRVDLGRAAHGAAVEQVTDARFAARAAQHVLVGGAGRLPTAIATLLRSTGVGRVDLGRWAADVADADVRLGAAAPDLVVLVSLGAVDPRAGEPWRQRGVPHLPVVGDGGRVVIGPLVGHHPALPCLGCLQLTRGDRDAEWPAVMAQAAHHGSDVSTDAAVTAIASGVVGMIAHAALADEPMPAGVSVEVALPWPRLDHRRWERHPSCPDHGAPVTPPPSGSAAARVTMTG